MCSNLRCEILTREVKGNPKFIRILVNQYNMDFRMCECRRPLYLNVRCPENTQSSGEMRFYRFRRCSRELIIENECSSVSTKSEVRTKEDVFVMVAVVVVGVVVYVTR